MFRLATAAVAAANVRFHGTLTGNRSKPPVSITWVLPNGKDEKKTLCFEGQTLLEVAAEHNLPVEGACGGCCACSTCHVVLEPELFDVIPQAQEKEEDMLDLAFKVTPTSRLGCQVCVTRKLEGTVITLPAATRNMAVDGYVAKSH